ncbi:hypothetical protein HN865_05040 [Candidatus Woesearchaeota archaeon]|jgi:hypothetical protein|nr:hypothetical protein [Candidatus Woesearchaeota archaeon]
MKKSLPILFTLALAFPLKAELPNQICNTIDTLIETKSEIKIKKELEFLADKLGNNDNIQTNEEMTYALELLISEESQKYITNKILGKPKTINELSLYQKFKIKVKYPQVVYIRDFIKSYLE